MEEDWSTKQQVAALYSIDQGHQPEEDLYGALAATVRVKTVMVKQKRNVVHAVAT